MRRDHGGHLNDRSDLGNVYLDVVLNGIHDSDNIQNTDPNLESTGTYSICHAPFPPNLPESECLTWTPMVSNYTWHKNVQLHVRSTTLKTPTPTHAPHTTPCSHASAALRNRSFTSRQVRNSHSNYAHTHTL